MPTSKVRLCLGGTICFELDPGCTISWNISRDLRPQFYPNEQLLYSQMGRLSANSIRIDTRVEFSAVQHPYSPQSFDVKYLMDTFRMRSNLNEVDVLYWSSMIHYGRVKTITVTQRPGEGNLVDLSITFEVGKVITS